MLRLTYKKTTALNPTVVSSGGGGRGVVLVHWVNIPALSYAFQSAAKHLSAVVLLYHNLIQNPIFFVSCVTAELAP